MRQIAESIDIGPVDGEGSGLWAIQRPADNHVFLADGSACALDGLARDELLALQWRQEREFARQILAAPKGSSERAPSDAPGL